MLDVTWEWIALDKSALDVANTVAVEDGVEHDLLAPDEEYARWAKAAARSPELKLDEAAAIAACSARPGLRGQIRAVLKATAAGEPLPKPAVATLNKASRAAGVDRDRGRRPDRAARACRRRRRALARQLCAFSDGDRRRRHQAARLRCAVVRMFYRPRRRQQRWCSEPWQPRPVRAPLRAPRRHPGLRLRSGTSSGRARRRAMTLAGVTR